MSSGPAYTQRADISDLTWGNARLCVCSGVEKCRLGNEPPQVPTDEAHFSSATDATHKDSANTKGSGIRDKVLNLTERTLPIALLNLLSKGPNFALTRKAGKSVLAQ